VLKPLIQIALIMLRIKNKSDIIQAPMESARAELDGLTVTQQSECLQVSTSGETYSPGHTGALCKQWQHTLPIAPRFRLGPRRKYLWPVTRTVSVTQFNKVYRTNSNTNVVL
jgi:hypothetical protein